jgi:hypothetical protein
MDIAHRTLYARRIAASFALIAFTILAPRAAVSEDGAWIGIFTENGPEDMSEAASLEQRLNRRFASMMWFTDFGHPFPLKAAQNAWAAGAVPNVTWEPWLWSDNEKIHLADINSGAWDAYISAWGAAAAAFGKPLFVRWGHEFNGDWYPWGIAKNGQDPANYIKAYRRVHDLVARSGAKNITWVWCPNSGSVPAQDWNDPLLAYPGDDYVDWIAVDGYDFDGNASFADIFSKMYAQIVQKLGKPIYIGEFATGRVGKEKAAWLAEMSEALPALFPGVKGLVYFSVKKERDWRLDDSPEALAGARDALARPFYKSSREDIAGLADGYRRDLASYRQKLTSAPEVGRKSYSVARIALGPDGEPLWKGVPSIAVEGKGGFGGAVSLGWDSERLYIKAELTDPNPLVNSGKDDGIWNGDCLELCVSTDVASDPARRRFGPADWQLGFAPADEAKAMPARSWEWSKLRSQIPGAEVESVRTDKGYTLKASMPWQALKGFKAEASLVLGFDLAVDDAGASGTRSNQWIWNGSNQFYNDPSQWGVLKLAP